MKIYITIRVDERGRSWLRTRGGAPWREVLSVREACGRLRRTRRQVYRYIHSAVLRPRAKLLGEWLLDSGEVENLARRPAKAQPIPRRLQVLFPEYRVGALNAGRDSTIVLSRVLERGGCRDLRWAMRRYRAAEFREFLKKDGARLLSPRSFVFWRRYFGLPAETAPVRRRARRAAAPDAFRKGAGVAVRPDRRLGRLYGGAG